MDVAINTGSLNIIWTETSTAPDIIRYKFIDLPNPPNAPTSLGGSSYVNGSAVSVNQPTLQFTLTDPNLTDTLQYRVQIDDSADFGTPVVDYTSALSAQGAMSFTVGQAAGGGTYTVGSASQTLAEGSYYWRVMSTDSASLTSSYVTANSGAVAFIVDTLVPSTNATSIVMLRSTGDIAVPSEGWTKGPSPYFSWTAGEDNSGGSGLLGYCLYLGTSVSGDPASSKGFLGTSPVSTTGTTCQFIAGTSNLIDFATASYKGSTWLTASTNPYYLNIKAVDNAGNITAASTQFKFYYDNDLPTNVAFIVAAPGSFSNVVDMSFLWPSGSSDATSGLLGWQYQLNSSTGTWQGSTHSDALNLDYIASPASDYIFDSTRDGPYVVVGSNTIYFRAIDRAGNISPESEMRTGNINYAGDAPAFKKTDVVTITPTLPGATTNSFNVSWPAATAAPGRLVGAYYYMINTLPPATYATLSQNSANYFNVGTIRTLSTKALPNVNKGSNTIYVVAVDNSEPPNYSPSNYISANFSLNSSDPDNVVGLTVSDGSNKGNQQWFVALTWTAPSYQGAGNLSYIIKRSADGVAYEQVGLVSGLSTVDKTPESALYYYKVYTKDGAGALSSGTNAVSITPTGKWLSAPTLESAPVVSSITTMTAKIGWSTNRTSDSKVKYGLSSGSYYTTQPSNSTQVATHSISLTNLAPGTKYYYAVMWTDEDGNTGTSTEYTFTTSPAPYVSSLKISNISINSAYVTFTINNAAKATLEYGKTTDYGGIQTISTSSTESTYTIGLSDLTEGTKYHLRVVSSDDAGNKYNSDDYTFETLPTPKIDTVRIQQVSGMPSATLRILWSTNTPVTSIVTYYPENSPERAKDQVNLALVKSHQMIITDLLDSASYKIAIKGKDSVGNSASSDTRTITTMPDLRAPELNNVLVESTVVGLGSEAKAQIIVSWDTDEPGTSQVEYAQGTGTAYGQSTQEDTNLTTNHVVTVTGLTPSKIYHLRALSNDKVGNIGQSLDTVVITPKYTQDALTIVIDNLSKTFGFLRK
jgi:hypothetical protein